jgi:putative hemolysin
VESPTRFLSTVQVGITLIGILSGAYGGATIAEELAAVLNGYPAIAPYSEAAAVGIVVVILSYVSVIVGELVPKRIALSNPERFAATVARPMIWLSRLGAPAVAALEYTSDVIMKVFRLPHGGDSAVTEADVASMVAAGTAAGIFDPVERRIVERAFRLDEPVAAIMTPRTEIVWIEVHDLWSAQRETSVRSQPDLRSLLRQPLYVPERSPTLGVLEQFQTTGTHIAIIIDEHGGVDGLLTLNNILTFLVAPPANVSSRQEEPAIVQRTADSWLVDGALSLGDFYSGIGVEDPEADRPRAYHTVAGLVMTALGHIPAVGNRVEVGLLSLEVVDMDGFRVDKVLVTRTVSANHDE